MGELNIIELVSLKLFDHKVKLVTMSILDLICRMLYENNIPSIDFINSCADWDPTADCRIMEEAYSGGDKIWPFYNGSPQGICGSLFL